MLKPETLLIFDFDGVISDTEELWVKIWVDALKKYKNLTLTPQEVNQYLVGLSMKTKLQLLNNAFPEYNIGPEFIDMATKEEIKIIKQSLTATPGVEEIFKDKTFAHCIATGATTELNKLKLEALGFWGTYFDEHNVFTSNMVRRGKPAPDLFLLAAQKMGYTPQNCCVIEDSLAGFAAAQAAGMRVIAFIGSHQNNNEAYQTVCSEVGVDAVINNMKDLHSFLRHNP